MDPASLRLRRATIADLDALQAIEAEAFSGGWPPTAFRNELADNRVARYVLAEDAGGVLGFAGLWLQFDQAHIVTVAVRPAERGAGLGRLLVHALLRIADDAGMGDATLEVRASNIAARTLYRRYGFHVVGNRPRYYAENGEDAIIMTTETLTSPAFTALLATLEDVLAARFGDGIRTGFEPVAMGF